MTFYDLISILAPCDHLLLSNRCHAYASLDQYQEALADAEHVVDLRPDWPKGYFRRGRALYGLGHYEDAAVAFLQCLALDQKVSSAKEYLSKVFFANWLTLTYTSLSLLILTIQSI